jgi:hypothetical protein
LPLPAYLDGHTHRQHLTWLAWLEMEWDRPGRSDHYLMSIACEVRRVLSKKPDRVKLDHFWLKFAAAADGGTSASLPASREQAAQASKARWGMMLAKLGPRPEGMG